MALTTPVHQETNLIGRVVNTAVTATSTTIYVQFTDSKTGVAREPQSNTLYFTFDKDNSRFEIIKCDSHTTTDDVTTLTVNAAGRAMPLFGIGAGGATGKTHPIGSQVGCVDVHWPYEIINNILDGSEGTSGTDFKVGDETDVDTTYYAWNGDANRPFVRYDAANNKWVFSNDGTTTTDVGGGTGSITAGDGIDIAAGVVSVDLKADSGLEISATELAVKLVATGGIDVGAAGLVLDLTEAGYTAGNLATVIADVTASSAEINQALDGISANVTDTNLNTLTAGPTSVASSLHTHQKTSGDYVYGDTIAVGDVLYLDYDDNKVKRITSSADTWKRIVGVALESGVDTNTGKLVLLEGLVTGASFNAINPTWSGSSGATTMNVGGVATETARAVLIDNTGGAEALPNEVTVRAKKQGSPSVLNISLVYASTAGIPAFGRSSAPATVSIPIATGSLAGASMSGVFEDYTVTLTPTGAGRIPSNSYVFLVFDTGTVDAVNYVQLEGTTSSALTLNSGGVPFVWSSVGARPEYTLTTTSVNPWDEAYGVRAYNGTAGGITIGNDTGQYSWNRVIGHVVSDTTWYFNPQRRVEDSGWFYMASGALSDYINTDFRPTWIDWSINSQNAGATNIYFGSGSLNYLNAYTYYYQGLLAGELLYAAAGAVQVAGFSDSLIQVMADVNEIIAIPFEQGFLVLRNFDTAASNYIVTNVGVKGTFQAK